MSNGNILDLINNVASSRINVHSLSSQSEEKTFVYSRAELMRIKETPASNEIPDYLSKDFIDEKGVFSVENWMDHIWEVNGITNKNEGKLKKPRTFIKKDDHSNFDTVANILSPQRKGFSGGCRAASPESTIQDKSKSSGFNSNKFKSSHDSFGKASPLVGSDSRRLTKEYPRMLDKDTFGRGKSWNTSDSFKPSFARNNSSRIKHSDRSQSDEEVPEWLDDECDLNADFELRGFDEDDDFFSKKNRNKKGKKESEADIRSRSGSVLSSRTGHISGEGKDGPSNETVNEYLLRLQIDEDKKDNKCGSGLAGSRLSKFFVSNIEKQQTNSPSPIEIMRTDNPIVLDNKNKDEIGSENLWGQRQLGSEHHTGESLLSKLIPSSSQQVPNSPVRRIGNMELDANLRAKGVALEDVEKSMMRCVQETPQNQTFPPSLFGHCPSNIDPATFYKAVMHNEVMGRAFASQNMQMKKMTERQNEIPCFSNEISEDVNDEHYRRLDVGTGQHMPLNMHPQVPMGMSRGQGVPIEVMQKLVFQQQMNLIFSQQAMSNPHHRQMVIDIRNSLIARAPELANNVIQLNIATAQLVIARQNSIAAERLRNAQFYQQQQQQQSPQPSTHQQQSPTMYYQGGSPYDSQQIKKSPASFAASNNAQDPSPQSKLNSFVPTSVIRQMHKSGQCNNSNSGRTSNSQTPTSMLSNVPQHPQTNSVGMINDHVFEDQRKYSNEVESKPEMKGLNISSMSDIEKAKLQSSYNNVLHAMTSGLPMQGWKMTNSTAADQAFLAQQTLLKTLSPAQQIHYLNSLRIKQQQQLAASYRTGVNQQIPGININHLVQPNNRPVESNFNQNAHIIEPNANYVSPDANMPNATESGQIKASILMKLPPSAKPVSVEDLERELIQSSAK
ncbi:Hypothetical protein SRAE_2000267400 [Strongyloides ratti]|uniref:Uncharacterized protein n=1 Tax=Strongyloides ratti TaxID=34506 RepID=A0A090LIQ5_STRRB|nr:Hypothetical protein SRAE_2000267400 [Strongyloides ratti]CEF68013.1 Hypothetical protein SRAE_2000267400 [Strongyloides ratti]